MHPWTSFVVTLIFMFLCVAVPWGWFNLARAADVQQISTQLTRIERRALEHEICNLDKARQKATNPDARRVIADRYSEAQSDYHDLTDDYYPTDLCVE